MKVKTGRFVSGEVGANKLRQQSVKLPIYIVLVRELGKLTKRGFNALIGASML
jgi:hypothetical protein